MKKVHLVERSLTGQYYKNESYDLWELKNTVIINNSAFFSNWLFGKIRKAVVDVIFATFEKLIDLDKPGVHRVENRN